LLVYASSRYSLNVLFFDKLRRAGFIEGQNLAINYLAYAAHIDLISQYAAELVIAQPDVIYAAGGVAIGAVQQATKSIPIVGIAADMVGEGLVESFGRPNGNTTGISILAFELDGKRQDILIEAVPGIRRMAVLGNPNNPTEANARALKEAARAKNVELSIYRITRAEEIVATVDKAHASGATALNVLESSMIDGNTPLIIERVAALRLPAMYMWGFDAAERGGFIGYGPPIDHLADLTARFAASLLRGTMPADLPVEQPTKFELVINLKTAKAMGVTVPEALLARADRVME
jgi:putative ABC transport system substrate-binding protein